MNQSKFWSRLLELIASHDLLRHPFYEAWKRGDLTPDDIREYATDYYYHVASFPAYLRGFIADLPPGELKHAVLQNLREEIGMEGGDDRAHNLLWIDFAVGAGAILGEVFNREPMPEIKSLVETFHRLARSGEPAQALAAFYVYESQVPRIASEKAKTLRSKYGFSEAACRYFTVHITADIAHAAVWREQLQKVLNQNSSRIEESLIAAEQAAVALWRALDGIDARRTLNSSSPAAAN